MRRLTSLLLLSCTAALCQSPPNQFADTMVFRAILSAQNEVPATSINASGTATLFVHMVRDRTGRVVSASTDFDVSHNFPGATTFTGLHIHRGIAGINGPVTVDSGLRAATPVVSSTGVGRIRLQGQTAPTDVTGLETISGLLTNPADYYVNLHTTDFPGGAIRGQLQAADVRVLMGIMTSANEVPAIQGLNASGIGSVMVIASRDASGRITSGQVSFDLSYQGFPEGMPLTGFHIHDGSAGVNGPVTINTGLAATSGLTAGSGGAGNLPRFDVEVPMNNAASVKTLNGLFTNPEDYYINLHTTANPGGAIRAQLRTTDFVKFDATLMSSNEVPQVDVAALAPSAFSAATMRNAAGDVIGAVAIFDVNYRVTGAATFTGLHVHSGAAGTNGPVTIDSGLRAADNLGTTTGAGNVYRWVALTSPAALTALNNVLANPDQHYMNIHTSANPGGLMRAQLSDETPRRPFVGNVISAVSVPTFRDVAPGGLATVFGQDLMRVRTRILDASDPGSAPAAWNGTTVRVGTAVAPIIEAGRDYLVIQIPKEVERGPHPLTVTTGGGVSNAFEVAVRSTAPALFFDSDAGIFIDMNYRLTGRSSSPAHPGDYVTAFGTGFTLPAQLQTGQAASTELDTTGVTATVDGQAAPTRVTTVPGSVGLYWVVVQVPTNARAGRLPVVVRQGDAVSNSIELVVQ